MDFYGGWKGTWGDWGLDVGAIYYYYPGSATPAGRRHQLTNARHDQRASRRVNNKEVYIGGSWKFLSLKYFHSLRRLLLGAAHQRLRLPRPVGPP
jgi:hypothetical protein